MTLRHYLEALAVPEPIGTWSMVLMGYADDQATALIESLGGRIISRRTMGGTVRQIVFRAPLLIALEIARKAEAISHSPGVRIDIINRKTGKYIL